MDKKALSLPILIGMVVGNMIGTGIFVLPATLANFGTISILSWGITSVGAMLLALTFTHLNRRYVETGGPYAYCKHAFGSLPAFVIAIIYWFSEVGSVAGLSIASVGYLGYIFSIFNANLPAFNPHFALAAELTIIWTFTIINMLGIHFTGLVQLCLTIMKISPLIIIVLFGLGHVQWMNFTHLTTGQFTPFSAISSAAAITFWAFVGLEVATVPAESTRGPRDITRATLWGTLISATIYIASTIVLMGMIPTQQLATSQFPFAEAGNMIFGPMGALFIAIFACLSGIGALNVCIFLQGQIIFSAARDRLFPAWLAKLSKKDAPIRGIFTSSLIVSLLLALTTRPTLLQQFNFIIFLAALLTIIVYLASAIAEIKLSIQSNRLHALITQSTIIALLAAIYAIWMITSMQAIAIKIALIIMSCCVVFYYLFVKKYNRQSNSG
jgi:APA family basic amino acid/polyamine antiporter